MLTERQQHILNALIQEYLDDPEPISSNLLKEKYGLDASPATIRNELQELTQQGYLAQPHTSAGRVPTNKGYRYFVEITFTQKPEVTNAISKEIQKTQRNIAHELSAAHELAKSLENISSTLKFTRIEDKDKVLEILEILGPSRTVYDKHTELIQKLIKELENF